MMMCLKLSLLSALIAFMNISCETMRGVQSKRNLTTTFDDTSCVIQAIKSVEGIRYLDSYTKIKKSKTWKNEPISTVTHYFVYEISDLSRLNISSQKGKKPRSQIHISEMKSNNLNYNSISYSNFFGHMNGRDYSDHEKSQAKRLISALDQSVIKQCKLNIQE